MSKKDEAFELFGQGKGIEDPEVVALGLKEESLEKYYREWGKLGQTLEEPVEEPKPEAEPVEEPELGQTLEEPVEEPEPVITTLLLNGKLITLENGIPVEPV